MALRIKPLTTGEVARYCHVTVNGVKKWITDGKLNAFQLPGGHYRVAKRDFLEFLIKYNIPIEDDFFGDLQWHILVVDDDEAVVKLVKGLLERSDPSYIIETAIDGYDALMKVGEFKPDLLILDMWMPRVDGFEVVRRLRENPQTQHIKLITITGEMQDDFIERVNALDVDDRMFKPMDTEKLVASVRNLLGIDAIKRKARKRA